MLGSSGVLLAGIVMLWRRGMTAYISAFAWQSVVLALLTAAVGYFGHDPELYWVAGLLFADQGRGHSAAAAQRWPRFASTTRTGAVREHGDLAASSAACSILLAYAAARPLLAIAGAPTRGGMPLAMGLLFVSLFIIVSRRKAVTQVIGFLMLENAIALLAVLGTYGVPLIVELGVFLDVADGVPGDADFPLRHPRHVQHARRECAEQAEALR